MRNVVGLRLSSVVLIAGLVAVVPAVAQAPEATEGGENVLITVRIGRFDGERRTPVKAYELVVAAGSPGSKLLSGARVPFPRSLSDTAEGDGPAPGIVYQNIGFVTEARAWILDKKKIQLVADIEDSRVVEDDAGGPPRVETRQLSVNAVLKDGEPLQLTRAQGITDQDGYVEVEARILR